MVREDAAQDQPEAARRHVQHVVQPPLAGTVGVPAQEDHADDRHGVGNGGNQADREVLFVRTPNALTIVGSQKEIPYKPIIRVK